MILVLDRLALSPPEPEELEGLIRKIMILHKVRVELAQEKAEAEREQKRHGKKP